MAPDSPDGLTGHELIIVSTTTHGWTVHNGEITIIGTYSTPMTTPHSFTVGERIGWYENGTIRLKDSSVLAGIALVITTHGAPRHTPVSAIDAPSRRVPHGKLYLAFNEMSWRKRKKGRGGYR